MKLLTLLTLGLCLGISAHANEHNVHWKNAIQGMIGEQCSIDSIDAIHELKGKDGFIVEGWVVQSCLGKQRYLVTYFPPEHYPDKSNDHEVKLVKDADKKI